MNLTMDQQKYAILQAVELKMVSAIKLDPETKGTGISKMKRGANVSAEVVNRRYENLLKHIGEEAVARILQTYPGQGEQLPHASEKESPSVSLPSQKPEKIVPSLEGHLEYQRERIIKLEARLIELEKENEQLKEKLEECNRKPIKIDGWSLVQRNAGGGNHKYWYAGKSRGGRMRWIYLGKELDLQAAKAKIRIQGK